jgi:hypothetical protein
LTLAEFIWKELFMKALVTALLLFPLLQSVSFVWFDPTSQSDMPNVR